VSLGHEYDRYSDIEYRFHQLICNENVLKMWRDSRRAA